MTSQATAAAPSLARRRIAAPTLLVVGAVVAAGALLALVFRPTGGSSGEPGTALAIAAFEQETGIRITRVAVTGGGGLIDFRYQVIDPDRAVVVRDRQPVLVDEDTGGVIDVLWGHQGHREFVAGRTYYLLFVNRQGLIEQDDKASVWVGDKVLEHVAVL